MDNSNKIILDLCGGTGSWSKYYAEAGYDVRIITLPEHDVRYYKPPEEVYGVLAAPPCTHFSIACNRLWDMKDKDGRTIEGLSILIGCLRIISEAKPVFWAIENPVGRMKRFLGKPTFIFEQTEFGFPCKKKTLIWGNFNFPQKQQWVFDKVYKLEEIDYKMPELYAVNGIIETDHSKRAAVRSITPDGFSRAFFDVNQ
jgi:hypothetical protein